MKKLTGPQKTVTQTVSLVVLMGGLAWASVPFYDWFCRVTGFGGTISLIKSTASALKSRCYNPVKRL